MLKRENNNVLAFCKNKFCSNSSPKSDVSTQTDFLSKQDTSRKQDRSKKQDRSNKQDRSYKQDSSSKQDVSFNLKNVDLDFLIEKCPEIYNSKHTCN